MACRSTGPNQPSSESVGTEFENPAYCALLSVEACAVSDTSGSKQICGSAAPSPVWDGLNVGFQPPGMNGSRLQRNSGFRPS